MDDAIEFLKRAKAYHPNFSKELPPPIPLSITTDATGGEPPLPTILSDHVNYTEDILEDSLLNQLKIDLPTRNYLPTGKSSPSVYLFGNDPYVYNRATKKLNPVPINNMTSIGHILDVVNTKLGKNYNSILVNKYRNRDISLDWHKDDESEVDQTVPISTLSVGAQRRFMISDSKTMSGRTQMYEKEVTENSILVMAPTLQETCFHRVASGRASITGECGVRFSLTFRRILPKTQVQPPKSPQPTEREL